ncbi:hypothetical protein TNCV_1726401 [Trichonephila clavipes]|nr:hypothetical protein TNCV_1726401 [Trichonephila clavipes]
MEVNVLARIPKNLDEIYSSVLSVLANLDRLDLTGSWNLGRLFRFIAGTRLGMVLQPLVKVSVVCLYKKRNKYAMKENPFLEAQSKSPFWETRDSEVSVWKTCQVKTALYECHKRFREGGSYMEDDRQCNWTSLFFY